MRAAYALLHTKEQQPETTVATEQSAPSELDVTTAATSLSSSAGERKRRDPYTSTKDDSDAARADAMLDLEDVAQQSECNASEESNSESDSSGSDTGDAGDENDEDGGDEDASALKKAARAGIRLLEENAQLSEEVRHLQLQLAHADEHTLELQRVLSDKDKQIEQLEQHLRESIRENQSVMSELNQTREQLMACRALLTQQTAAAQSSPRKRLSRTGSFTQAASATAVTASTPRHPVAVTHDDVMLGTASDSVDISAAFSVASPERPPLAAVASAPVDQPSSLHDSAAATSLVERISPKRRQVARLEEVEQRFEEAHRRNSLLLRELSSAQKTLHELKPLSAQLHETREEAHVLRTQTERLERELQQLLDERTEERALLQSLRATVEIYQCLDDPTRGHQPHDLRRRGVDASDDDLHVRRLSRMRRRNSDGCVLPLAIASDSCSTSVADVGALKPPVCWTTATVSDYRRAYDDREAVLESLDALSEQVLRLEQFESRVQSPHTTRVALLAAGHDGDASATSRASDDSTLVPRAANAQSRLVFIEQHVAVLQDLLRRYRAQSQHATQQREVLEAERTQLLHRIDALGQLAQRQCESCARVNEALAHESEAWRAAASAYETMLQHASASNDREDAAEAERVSFALLRRLVDSWTADKSQRMRLHDWLTNAIRGTGIRRALYLPDLTAELASGFQMLLVPVLREQYGVTVTVEQRLRNVVVTDLQLHVTQTDDAKAKACLQRVSRSLLRLVDTEAAQFDDNEWLAEVSRKRVTRICICK